jgi:hypothetical protein
MFKKLSKLFSSDNNRSTKSQTNALSTSGAIDDNDAKTDAQLQQFSSIELLGSSRSLAVSCIDVDIVQHLIVYGTHSGSVFLKS